MLASPSGAMSRVRRRRGVLAGILALAAIAIPIGNPSSAQTVPVQASCYDAFYFDGLTSRYSASSCASAVDAAGYTGTAYHNATAQTAAVNSARDGVFFFAGHALVAYDNNCSPACSGPHAGVSLMYESPDQNGNLDALAGDPIVAAEFSGADALICTDDNTCRSQLVFAQYPWGLSPQNYKSNLVVLEGCSTANDTANWTSIATSVSLIGAGTVIGFTQDIGFSVNQDNSNLFGDGWANRFWSDLQAGWSYTAAATDASNSVGNANGYGSVKVLQAPGAPQSLYPSQYFL